MSDLVKRLRGERVHLLADIDIRLEAADFIEAQAAHIRELEAELAAREARGVRVKRAMHEEMCGCLKGTKPSSASVEANIERSTEALQRIRKKFAKPGVRLSIKKGVPLYSVDENNPGMFVRVLDGVTQRGHFVDGEFVALP